MGFTGGIVGLTLAAVVVYVANDVGQASGTVLFRLTSLMGVWGVALSTLLGAISGLLPA